MKIFNRSVKISGKGCKLGFNDRATGTDTSQAITLNSVSGVIRSSTTNLAAATSQAITMTNQFVKANSIILANVETAGANGAPVLEEITCSAGQAVFKVRNVHASQALNAAYTIKFLIIDLD